MSQALPDVGVIMGSDSDWSVMEAAAQVLDELGISCEVDVVSAHRMPSEMLDYGSSAEMRGLRVIIAGAGALKQVLIDSGVIVRLVEVLA